MSGIKTILLWSSELEQEVQVPLSRQFIKWYDGKRRTYVNKYPKESDENRLKMAYRDFMER